MNGTRKFLVFAPHADDAELGMGGMLYDHNVSEKRVVIMATGSYRRFDGMFVSAKEREEEARSALAILGVTNVAFARSFEENRSTEEPFVQIVQTIEKHIAIFRPTDVFVSLPSFNQDHRRLFDAFIAATRPGACDWVQALYAYEYPGNAWGPPTPEWGKTYVPLSTRSLRAKMTAIEAHKSQWEGRGTTHVGPAGALQLSFLRGSECGHTNAELLYQLRGRFQ